MCNFSVGLKQNSVQHALLNKIGCGSAIKIKQVLFCIALAFRYLCIVNYYFA